MDELVLLQAHDCGTAMMTRNDRTSWTMKPMKYLPNFVSTNMNRIRGIFDFVKTQNRTISDMLSILGVRSFDMRCFVPEHVQNTHFHHGVIFGNYLVSSALQIIVQFLDANPSEFVHIILVLNGPGNHIDFRNFLREMIGLKHVYGGQNIASKNIGDGMRGKCIVWYDANHNKERENMSNTEIQSEILSNYKYSDKCSNSQEHWKGEYNSITNYSIGDITTYQSNVYMSQIDSVGILPSRDFRSYDESVKFVTISNKIAHDFEMFHRYYLACWLQPRDPDNRKITVLQFHSQVDLKYVTYNINSSIEEITQQFNLQSIEYLNNLPRTVDDQAGLRISDNILPVNLNFIEADFINIPFHNAVMKLNRKYIKH
jgi:hypothetical protein